MKLATDQLSLGGRPIRLANLKANLLNVYAELDHICQPGQSIPQTRHGTQPLTAPAMPQMSQPQPRAETTPPAPSKSHASRAAHGGSKSCSWPMGDPKQAGFHFCGEPAEPGRPYCTNHCHVAYHKKSEAA